MSDIDKIRQEIDFLKELNEGLYTEGDNSYYEGQDNGYNHILVFIDSLPEEKPSEDLEEATKNIYKTPFGTRAEDFIAGAVWQANRLLKGSPLPEDTVLFQKGVEEGRRLEKEDLALTWKDMVLLRTLFDATDAKQSRGALTVQPMTREYYEYLLREFNEQRKK